MTKRQEIVDYIGNAIKAIKRESGHSIDVKAVYDWLTTPLSESDLPAAVVRDTDDDMEKVDVNGPTSHTLKIEVELLLAGGDGLEQLARDATGDLLQVIGALEKSGDILFVSPTGASIAVEQAEGKVASVRIDLRVDYLTENWMI